MYKRVFIAKIEDWQAIYIDGECIEQRHDLAMGDMLYMMKMAKEYDFNLDDVRTHYYRHDSPVDEYAKQYGCFPKKLDELLEMQEIDN